MKEFKNLQTQVFYSWLQSITEKTITYNFYTANHAHNICDGHAATAKRAVSKEEITTDNVPVEPQDFVRIIQERLAYTVAIEITYFHEYNYDSIVNKWSNGIKKFHAILVRL